LLSVTTGARYNQISLYELRQSGKQAIGVESLEPPLPLQKLVPTVVSAGVVAVAGSFHKAGHLRSLHGIAILTALVNIWKSLLIFHRRCLLDLGHSTVCHVKVKRKKYRLCLSYFYRGRNNLSAYTIDPTEYSIHYGDGIRRETMGPHTSHVQRPAHRSGQ